MKTIFALSALAAVLPIAASIPTDATIRRDIVGTWTYTARTGSHVGRSGPPILSITFVAEADGGFQATRRDGTNVDTEVGTWSVSRGSIILRPLPSSGGQVETNKVVSIDARKLVIGDSEPESQEIFYKSRP